MNHKFQFCKCKGTVQMDDAIKKRRADLIRTLNDGDYEIIIRKVENWDVSQMNKFFHGVILSFVAKGYKSTGNGNVSPQDVRRFLKAKYIGYDTAEPIWRAVKMLDHYKNKSVIEPSTADIDAFLATEKLCSEVGIVLPIKSLTVLKDKDEFHAFIDSINALCKDKFNCELPPSNEVE